MTKLEEMLAARQAPGIRVSSPVRSAVMRDATGKTTRVLYAGGVGTASLERDMVKAAEQDGLDLSKARMEFTPENGQGVGRNQNKRTRDITRKIKNPA